MERSKRERAERLRGYRALMALRRGIVQLRVEADEAFARLDTDGDGRIDRADLDTALRRLGQNLDAPALDAALAEADANGTGSVSRDEFRALLERRLGPGRTDARTDALRRRRRSTKTRGARARPPPSRAAASSMRKLTQAGAGPRTGVTEAEARDLFAIFDKDGDDQIGLEDLRHVSEMLGRPLGDAEVAAAGGATSTRSSADAQLRRVLPMAPRRGQQARLVGPRCRRPRPISAARARAICDVLRDRRARQARLKDPRTAAPRSGRSRPGRRRLALVWVRRRRHAPAPRAGRGGPPGPWR